MLDENGFIGDKHLAWQQSARAQHTELWTDAEQLNRAAHSFISGRPVDLSDGKKLVLGVLFLRMLELYQAELMLCGAGMRNASSATFRVLIEAYFHFDALVEDDDYLADFLRQFHMDRKRMAAGIARSKSVQLEGMRSYFTEERANEAQQEALDAGARVITTEEAARRGGNEGIYRTAYALLSGEVHTSARSLERHLRCDSGSDEIIGLAYGPDDSDIYRNLSLCIILLSECLSTLAKFLEAEVPEVATELYSKYDKSIRQA